MKRISWFVLACTIIVLSGCGGNSNKGAASEKSPPYESTTETSDPNTITVVPSEIFENIENQLKQIAGDQYVIQAFIRDDKNYDGEGLSLKVELDYTGKEYTVEDVLNHVNSFGELVNQKLEPVLGFKSLWISNGYVSGTAFNSRLIHTRNEEDWKLEFSERSEDEVNLEYLNRDRRSNGLPVIDTSNNPDYTADGEYKPVEGMTQDEIEDELTDMVEDHLYGD